MLVGPSGLEPPTSRLSGVRSNRLSYGPPLGGDERNRTADPLLARQVLSQLSYTPILNKGFPFKNNTSTLEPLYSPKAFTILLSSLLLSYTLERR